LQGTIFTERDVAISQDGYCLSEVKMDLSAPVRLRRHTHGALVSIASIDHDRIGFFRNGNVIKKVNLETLSLLGVAYIPAATAAAGSAETSSPNARFFVSGSSTGVVVIWDTVTGMIADVGHGLGTKDPRVLDAVQCVAVTEDGRVVAAGFWNSVVRVWKIHELPKRLSRSSGRRPKPPAKAMVQLLHTLRMEGGSPLSLALNAEFGFVLCGTNRILAWDLQTGELRHTLMGGTAFHIGFIAGSPHVIVSGGNTVRIWNVITGEELASFTLDTMIRTGVSSFAQNRLGLVDWNGRVQTFRLQCPASA